jgi:hypothetical protein
VESASRRQFSASLLKIVKVVEHLDKFWHSWTAKPKNNLLINSIENRKQQVCFKIQEFFVVMSKIQKEK